MGEKKKMEISEMKKMIKSIEGVRGHGSSIISLIMPPRDEISRVSKKLVDEYGRASNSIKSRAIQQAVLGAIAGAQQKLKIYSKVPPNGLVLYSGTIVNDQGKAKKVTIDFEPHKPINMSLYLCDNKFHTEALNEFLDSDDDKFGFIVMDGNGTLFGTLTGNTREVLHKLSVDTTRKQHGGRGGGGQSALQIARLRAEIHQHYLRKTAELATQYYINHSTSKPNVAGLILAGSADFKNELSKSDLFDTRLAAKVLKVVNVSHGGEEGFREAIKLSSQTLTNVKSVQENRLLKKYFEEIKQETGKYVSGVNDTLKALELGAMETLIVWDNLDINRYVMKESIKGETVIKHLNKEEEGNPNHFKELDVQGKMSLVAWLANEHTGFGCTLEFVTNKSEEGTQFCKGFGGIGGILRYQLDLTAFDD